MVTKTLEYNSPDVENLSYMNDLGMTYVEMAKCFSTIETPETIKYWFRKLGIKHKRKTDLLLDYLESHPFKSTGEIAIKFNVSKDLVNKTRRKMPQKIRIQIEHSPDNMYYCFTVAGHSGYAQRGHDIVCSSVSTLIIFVANTLNEWKPDIECKSKDGYLYLSYRVDNDVEYYITTSLIEHFQDLERQYPKNVQVIL